MRKWKQFSDKELSELRPILHAQRQEFSDDGMLMGVIAEINFRLALKDAESESLEDDDGSHYAMDERSFPSPIRNHED